MFERIRNEILFLIHSTDVKEVNNHTNNEDIGIYMIYIDNFDDERIIPFYIGQTGSGDKRCFQKRYKEHLQELMALNRLEYDYYKLYLLKGFYDGSYKACKMFEYMVNHNCTLKDFHMVVLETVSAQVSNIQEILEQKEQLYISKYLPAFLGFNQINSVIERNKQTDSIKIQECELEECTNFSKYWGFGYTKFNYYHCFNKESFSTDCDDLKKLKEILRNRYYDENRFKDNDIKLVKLRKEQQELNLKKENLEIEFDKKFLEILKEYCAKNQIGINQKLKEIKETLIFQNENQIKEINVYFKRKKINESIVNILNGDTGFVIWRKKYLDVIKMMHITKNEIYNNENVRQVDDRMRLLPKKDYNSFPLKDKYEDITFGEMHDNELMMNIEFSNHGLSDWIDYCITKIDYKLNKDSKIIEQKNIFINTYTNKVDKNEPYFECDFGDTYKFRKTPFNVKRYPDYISTTMEVQNGINDFTLATHISYSLNEILNKINGLIDESTSVKVMLKSKMKNKCRYYIEDYYNKDNILKNKLIEVLNSKK
ncbi:MAG: hypothetical protein IJ220_01495 [Clostridia bacterium]|nr:hypothetical protein [Clostridia bacterium]